MDGDSAKFANDMATAACLAFLGVPLAGLFALWTLVVGLSVERKERNAPCVAGLLSVLANGSLLYYFIHWWPSWCATVPTCAIGGTVLGVLVAFMKRDRVPVVDAPKEPEDK